MGTTNNHEVVTVSTDGRMCTWNLGQLDQPVETTTLKDGKKDIAVTDMVFPPSGDYNTFLCGSEDGCVYSSQVHSSKSQGGRKSSKGTSVLLLEWTSRPPPMVKVPTDC